jgi:hypothetical protein
VKKHIGSDLDSGLHFCLSLLALATIEEHHENDET